jgi:vacuolar-type H+-ATPase subunit H
MDMNKTILSFVRGERAKRRVKDARHHAKNAITEAKQSSRPLSG